MGDGAAFSLILHDLAEGHAGGIVDADVNELPADPASIALAVRSSVMRCPTRLNLPSFLMSMWISSLGCPRS
jgi:hypothetical protein